MSLRDLTNGEMISVSAPMVDPGSSARKAIDANPLTAAVVPKVIEAYNGLERLQRPASSSAVKALTEKLAELDVRHDNLARGFDSVLSGFVYFCTDQDRARELEALKILLPDGLKTITRSYLEESGQLRNLKSTMSSAHTAMMKSIQADGTSLFDRFVEWYEVGEDMRKIDLRRAEIEGDNPTGPTRSDNVSARNSWIGAVNGLIAMADLADLSEQARLSIFGQLDAVLARTTDRSKKPKAEPEPERPLEPNPDPSAGGVES